MTARQIANTKWKRAGVRYARRLCPVTHHFRPRSAWSAAEWRDTPDKVSIELEYGLYNRVTTYYAPAAVGAPMLAALARAEKVLAARWATWKPYRDATAAKRAANEAAKYAAAWADFGWGTEGYVGTLPDELAELPALDPVTQATWRAALTERGKVVPANALLIARPTRTPGRKKIIALTDAPMPAGWRPPTTRTTTTTPAPEPVTLTPKYRSIDENEHEY